MSESFQSVQKKMNDPWNSIDKVMYINLDHRTDRKVSIENEFKMMDITNYERFSAIQHNSGAIGCHMSHLSILKKARENKWKNCMIFEDDFTFKVSVEQLNNQLNHLFEKYPDFDVVMLGYNMIKCYPIDNIIGQVENAQTTSCYIVNSRFYDTLIDNLEKALSLHIQTNNPSLYACDMCWKALQPISKWYYFINRCGIQKEGYSDIEKRYVNYKV